MIDINYKYILIYLLVVNLIGYIMMWRDKKLAKSHQWRIQEKTLLTIALIGGSIGVWLGMSHFHHKTKHNTFKIGIPLIFFLQVALVVVFKQMYF